MKKLIGIVIMIVIGFISCQETSSILEPNSEIELEKKVEEMDSTNGSYKGKPILPRV